MYRDLDASGLHRRFVIDIASIEYWFVVLSLWYYVYLYFFPFDEGTSGAPELFKYLKYLAWGAVICVCMLSGRIGRRSGVVGYAGAILLWMFLLQLIHLPQYTTFTDESGMFIGNFFVFVPVLFLFHEDVATRVFNRLPFIMALQVIVSFCLELLGRNLWDDHAFVGGVGTHVAFGLLLDMAMLSLVCRRHLGVRGYVLLGVLFFGILYSKSLSALAVGVLAVGIVFLINSRRNLLGYLLIVGALFVGLIIAWEKGVISSYVVGSAVVALRRITGDSSLLSGLVVSVPEHLSTSVTQRQSMYSAGWEFLSGAPAGSLLFGDFRNGVSRAFDSQYLTILVNYGVISLGLFVSLVFWMLYVGYKVFKRRAGAFVMMGSMVFGLLFLFSRHLYYYPNSIVFFLFVILAWHQYVAPRRLSTASLSGRTGFREERT